MEDQQAYLPCTRGQLPLPRPQNTNSTNNSRYQPPPLIIPTLCSQEALSPPSHITRKRIVRQQEVFPIPSPLLHAQQSRDCCGARGSVLHAGTPENFRQDKDDAAMSATPCWR